MPHSRFFLDAPLIQDTEVLLSGDEAHHLSRVMRKKKGEEIELVNGKNHLAKALLLGSEKKGERLKIIEVQDFSPPAHQLILCQAILRPQKLDLIVEKGTELGMTALWLFPAELSEKEELSTNQLRRLEMLAISAMKQSGRLDLPEIVIKPMLKEWESITGKAYFGDVSSEAPHLISQLTHAQDTSFFVGPESGFSQKEEDYLKKLGGQGVRLHQNILRTETASLVALSLIAGFLRQV